MTRLSDLVKGGGEGSPRRGAGTGASPRLADLIRKPGTPGPPGPEGAPQEDGVFEGGRAATSQEVSGLVPADEVFRRAVDLVQEIHGAVRAHASVPIATAEEAVERLLGSLMASDALLVPFFSGAGSTPNLSRGAVNRCTLSLKMGLDLSYGAEPLRKLGLAAFLCDVGMARPPAQVLGNRSQLSSNDRAILETHHLEGAKLLRALEPQYRWLAEVVENRYAKTEGARLPETETEDYAAIIRLADLYDSLLYDRLRPRPGSLEALKEILKQERATTPDRILKALVRAMSAFPVGSLVRLNTGEMGRVVARNKELPLRPVVEVLVRRGKRLEDPMVIDLSQNPLHHIQDSIAEGTLP